MPASLIYQLSRSSTSALRSRGAGEHLGFGKLGPMSAWRRSARELAGQPARTWRSSWRPGRAPAHVS